jgi:hypothetical protein
MMPHKVSICAGAGKYINTEDSVMTKYESESMMVGTKRVSDKKALQGSKLPKSSHAVKAHKVPYDASTGTYMKKGGKVKKKAISKSKKMALGGAAKVRKGMASMSGAQKA